MPSHNPYAAQVPEDLKPVNAPPAEKKVVEPKKAVEKKVKTDDAKDLI